MCLRVPPLIEQDTSEARCRAQLERSRSLLAGEGDCLFIVDYRRRTWSAAGEEITEQTMDFRFRPSLAGFACSPKRLLERAIG